MRIFVKHGIAAVAAATLALACGNNQPAQAPSSTSPASANDPTHATAPINDPEPQKPLVGSGGPQEPAIGSGGPQEPMDKPLPQKPFYGPGTEPPDNRVLAKSEAPLSEAQVIGAAMTVNSGEIQMADLAMKKGTSRDVKQFAQWMIRQHGGLEHKEKSLEEKLKITGAESDVSGYMENEVSSTLNDLQDKEGKAFDLAYIESQVKAHKDALTAIDNRLLPSATNSAVKKQLTLMRRDVAAHLAKAEAIEKKMQSKSDVGTQRKGKTGTEQNKGKPSTGTTGGGTQHPQNPASPPSEVHH